MSNRNKVFDKNRTKIYKTIDELTLMDDDLMSKVFNNNIEATALLLRIILNDKTIKVISSRGQVEYNSPLIGGRTITLDIHAVDGTGRHFNVEVQRNYGGSHIRRARFNSSMMDARMLKEGEEFRDLKDSYVIFICEYDKFGKNLPVYHIERVIRETQELLGDGSHIIYVNGKYDGNDEIGKLMHDFRCNRYENMHYSELANGVRHFKETQEGSGNMCEAFEKLAKEIAVELAEEMAEEMAEKIAEEKAEKLAEEKAEKLAEEKAEKLAEKLAEEKAEKLAEEFFLSLINSGMLPNDAQRHAKISDSHVEKLMSSCYR